MTDTDDLLERGWGHLEDGDVESARRIGEKLLATDDGPAEGLLLLAACAREEGAPDRALGHLQQATAADPDWATPHLWIAEILSNAPDGSDRLKDALRHATAAVENAEEEEEYLDAVALKASLEIDLGKLDMARETLGTVPPVETTEVPTPIGLEFAHLFLGVGDHNEARKRFEAITDDDPTSADAWYGLGLAAEAQGDEQGKRKAWLKTLALDGKNAEGEDEDDDEAADGALSEDEVESVAEAALAELPPKARVLLENIPIIIADLPSRDDVATGLDPRLVGLFLGTPYPEVSAVGGTPQLTQILLFRNNLQRVTTDPDELRDEIRTTLLHETGHFFGMSEEDLAAVGLD
jgi:predicted Zn-dependent protease with MMP-like domain